MKIEYVPQEKKADVPLVMGGIYLHVGSGFHYHLCECRTGGFQLSGASDGTALRFGEFEHIDGVVRYLNDQPNRWVYIPDAVLLVPRGRFEFAELLERPIEG